MEGARPVFYDSLDAATIPQLGMGTVRSGGNSSAQWIKVSELMASQPTPPPPVCPPQKSKTLLRAYENPLISLYEAGYETLISDPP